MGSSNNKPEVKTSSIPYLPNNVNFNDLSLDSHSPNDLTKARVMGKYFQTDVGSFILPDNSKLGEGKFGAVHVAQSLDNGQWIVIKALKQAGPRDHIEIENLVKAKELVFSNFHKGELTFGMKLKPGKELAEYFWNKENDTPKNTNLSELQKLFIAKKILKRAADIHNARPHLDFLSTDSKEIRQQKIAEFRMLHRDIKADNLVLDSNLNVEFVDYGMGAQNKGKEIVSDKVMGTPMYMSPEVIKRGEYTEKSEVYALGKVLMEINGIAEFYLDNQKRINGKPTWQYRFSNDLSQVDPALINLIKRMCHDDPSQRPSINEAYRELNNLLAEKSKKESVKVSVVSIEHFNSLETVDQIKFINKLHKAGVNSIVFNSDSPPPSNLALINAKMVFENYGFIHIGPLVYHGYQNETLLEAVKSSFNAMFSTTNTQMHVVKYPRVEVLPKYEIGSVELSAVFKVTDTLFNKFNQILDLLDKESDKKKMKQFLSEIKSIPANSNQFPEIVRKMELLYKASLNESVSFLNKTPLSPEKINKETDKYAVARSLGIMLSSAYKVMNQIEEYKSVPKQFESHVEKVNSNVMTLKGNFKNLEFDQYYTPPAKPVQTAAKP